MKTKNNLPKRFLSRLIAAQILYQYDFHQKQKSIEILSKNLVENYFLDEEAEVSSYANKIDKTLFDSLLSGITLVQDKVDDEISAFLKGEWNIESLPDLILPILRLATFELKFMKDIPTKVVISQYVDLSACFYDAKQVTFVNSILQNIANKNRS